MIIMILILLVRKLRLRGLRNLLKVTQRVHSRIKTQTQFFPRQSLGPALPLHQWVLPWGYFCPLGDTWLCPETVLVVITGGATAIYW